MLAFVFQTNDQGRKRVWRGGVAKALRTTVSTAGLSVVKPGVIAALVVLMLAAASPPSAWAQIYKDSTSIGASTLTEATGTISVNQVAGVGNQQTNAALVTDVPGQ